jgi:hypothetical protein
MALRPGDKVMIYEDPYTQGKPEGTATLVNKEFTGPDGEEHWFVKFAGDREKYYRTICKPRDGKE